MRTVGAGVYLAGFGVPSTRVLPKLVLPHPSGALVEVYLQGAHVASWKRANGDEMLFMSANNTFAPGEPIRGGIPVVFPQFANLGSLPGHGFVRTMPWQVAETGTDSSGAVYAILSVSDTPATRALWPHSFRASLRVTLSDMLTTAITIANTDTMAFSFQCALHTYHRIDDLGKVFVEGVQGATYLDRTANAAERREGSAPLLIDGEVDRIYTDPPGSIRVRDMSRKRSVVVDRVGFQDVVVWNPGVAKARTNIKLPEGEYLNMVAVETAQIVKPVTLAPGASWVGSQVIRVE